MVTFTEISVPDMNDSMQRIVLSGTQYYIRFTWNDTGGFWKFGLYTAMEEPVTVGIKLVPNFPLTLYCSHAAMPDGTFCVRTGLERLGRYSFRDGEAEFDFIPYQEV